MRILITGHTSFEGAWLAKIAEQQGFEVYGVDLADSADPRTFAAVTREFSIEISQQFVENFSPLSILEALRQVKPDLVFHFLQLPHSKRDLNNISGHFQVNLQSTVSLVDALMKESANVKRVFVYSSDRNNLQDAHSLSHSFRSQVVSQAREQWGLPLRVVSWGSVIGSGDLRESSLVFQLMQDLLSDKKFTIQKPHSVRSFQSVQQVMSALMEAAKKDLQTASGPKDWVVGPRQQDMISVGEIGEKLAALVRRTDNLSLHRADRGPSYHPYPDTREFYDWLNLKDDNCESLNEIASWYLSYFSGKKF